MIAILLIHILINYQLKKEGRRNEYEMHKLLALNQRQKMVSWCSNHVLYKSYSDAVYPTSYMFIAGIAKEDRRSFLGYQKAKRTLGISKGFLTWNYGLGDLTCHAAFFPILWAYLTTGTFFLKKIKINKHRCWRWECSWNSGTCNFMVNL